MKISPEAIEALHSGSPLLDHYSPQIASKFFEDILEKAPEIKQFISRNEWSFGVLSKWFSRAMSYFVTNLENINDDPVLFEFCQRACAMGIEEKHLRRCCLIFDEVLKDALKVEFIRETYFKAWREALEFILQRTVEVIEDFHQENKVRGWSGFRQLKVAKKEIVGPNMVRLSFGTPQAPVKWQLGQYLSIRATTRKSTDWFPAQVRHFICTSMPGECGLSCIVKRLDDGVMSQFLHDELKPGEAVSVHIPMGPPFPRPATKKMRHILMSAGIGCSFISQAYLSLRPSQVAIIAHVDQDPESYPARDAYPEEKSFTYYSSENGNQLLAPSRLVRDVLDMAEHADGGMVTTASMCCGEKGIEAVNDFNLKRTAFVICGPKSWMSEVEYQLRELGAKHVHCEHYGLNF